MESSTGKTGITEGKSNNWFGTLNNPAGNPEDVLKAMFESGKATYAKGQMEKGESGTEHLQFWLRFPV